ncbi:MAG: hypothetical protein ACPHCN_18855, partial [Mycobacterium sp.]
LLVRVHPSEDKLEVGRRIQQSLRAHRIHNLVMVAHEGATVERLDEETMNAHGWFRKATKRTTPE